MRYCNWRSLFLVCILEFSAGYGILLCFSQSMKAQAFESHKLERRLFQSRSDLGKVYAEAELKSNKNVANLGKQLQELDKEADGETDRANKQEKREVIVKQLASIGSKEAYNILGSVFINASSRPYTYEIIINTLSIENPSLVFRIAEKASKQSSNKISPADLFRSALTGDIFKSMSPDDQRMLDQSDRSQYLRRNAVAALAYADYDVTNELIATLPAPELVAALIDVIGQSESLWCERNDNYIKRSNKIVSFSNKVLKQVGPQFIPTLKAAVKSNPSDSDASEALTNLKSALAGTNLNQPCPGCCGSWGQIYRGVLNILKPNH